MTAEQLALARSTQGAVVVCPTADRVASVRRWLAMVPCVAPRVVTPDAVPADATLVIRDAATEVYTPIVTRVDGPGTVGEARLVARRIRTRLLAGTAPSRIVLTGRGLDRAVWQSELTAHGVPAAWAEPEPLGRHPAVAFLLAAWPLPADDFPFPRVAAVLRSGWLRPAWPELTDPDLPAAAEGLLRAVGATRGRAEYLRVVSQWAESPPVPLEDESVEEGRRQRLHRLAVRCRPFLVRFFKLWARRPDVAAPRLFARELRRFASDSGLSVQVEDDPAWAAWWAAVGTLDGRRLDAEGFDARLRALANTTPQPPDPQRGDAVRVLPPDVARFADCDHLFVAGLTEGTFPRPAADPAAEPALFDALLGRPRLTLTLSRSATDDGGERQLPATFLADLGPLPTESQRMLIEGYGDGEPHTAAELRVRAARALAAGDPLTDWPLPDALRSSLRAAAAMAHARHRDTAFGRFDGELRHPAVAADLLQRFGPDKVFSPTALEAYIACPFRYWLEHVLRLEPLDDPAEDVEHTRRGQAVHRALSRLHQKPEPTDVATALRAELAAAVQEYADRAPSAVGRALWGIEGRRLDRLGAKYARHWAAFRAEWAKHSRTPGPHAVEEDFGVPGAKHPALVLAAGTPNEVRIGGRIDRVDISADGFWVIDYKTGRRTNYTPADLAAFKKVQLPLYALAVERVLLAGRPARPLGLAYWLVGDGGCRTVLPKSAVGWAVDADAWRAYTAVLETWVTDVASHLRAGDFPLAPRSERCTETCRFGPVCRIGASRHLGKRFALPLPVVLAVAPDGE